LLLRVTTGFLLARVGLAKLVNGRAPFALRNVDLDALIVTVIGLAAGGA
jgi:hypothetical protein